MIQEEDKLLQKEGLKNLTLSELNSALRERGMRVDKSEDEARTRMNKWIALSLTHKIPTSLLIMSRAFNIRLERMDKIPDDEDDAKTVLTKSEEEALTNVIKEVPQIA